MEENAGGAEQLRRMERIYVLCHKATGRRLPAIPAAGSVWVSETEEGARRLAERDPTCGLEAVAMSQGAFRLAAGSWRRLAIAEIVLEPDSAKESRIPLETYLQGTAPRFAGAETLQLLLRMTQARQSGGAAAQAAAVTWENLLFHRLRREVLLAAMSYEQEPLNVKPDRTLHYTAAAAENLRRQGKSLDEGLLFYGGGELLPAPAAENRVMRFHRTDGERGCAAVYTDLVELRAAQGTWIRVCAVTFSEIAALGAMCGGVTVNSGVSALTLRDSELERCLREGTGPLRIQLPAEEQPGENFAGEAESEKAAVKRKFFHKEPKGKRLGRTKNKKPAHSCRLFREWPVWAVGGGTAAAFLPLLLKPDEAALLAPCAAVCAAAIWALFWKTLKQTDDDA